MLKLRSKNSSGPKSLPLNVVASTMNTTIVDNSRAMDKDNFRLHVSNVIASKGPQRFCARHQVLSYHSERRKIGTKLTPARKLLFATGHFQHDFVVQAFIADSEYGQYVYAKWSCEDYTGNPRSPEYGKHDVKVETLGNVTKRYLNCQCGKPRLTHNEIDLALPNMLLVGHPDMVIRLGHSPATYKFYIYEFKTIDRADLAFDDIDYVLADHRLQVTFYYKIMKALKMNVSKTLRVMYIDRTNKKLFGGAPYKELTCPPEAEEFIQPIRESVLLVKQGMQTGRLPSRICKEITQDRAKNCEMAIECFLRTKSHVAPTKGRQVHSRGRPVSS